MTLDGYHVDGMCNKTWACWIFFAGFVLSLAVARGCNFSFENHITDQLLLDHWFEIRYFQHPDETVKDGYTLLSVLNIMCISLKKYSHLYDDLDEEESRRRVKWSYGQVVINLLNLTSRTDILPACERHVCNSSFSKSYISPDELKEKYDKGCAWNGTLPACPLPQTTSPSPSQVSHATSTPSPTHSSTSTPSYTTIHQSTSTMTSSSSQPRNMTSPSAPNSTMTSSSSQPRNMTSPSAPNNTETPPACQPTSSKNVTDNSGNMQKRADDIPEKTKDNVLLSLLTVSCTVNVALLILVLWQCRNRRPNNLQNHSEGNHQPPSEFTCLQKREQSEDNVNSNVNSTV